MATRKTPEELEEENGRLATEVERLRDQRRGARRGVKLKGLAHVATDMDRVRRDQAETGTAYADGAMAALERAKKALEAIDETAEEG